MNYILLSLLAWVVLFYLAHKHPIKGVAFSNRGGGGTEIVQSTPAPQPSTADAINAWVQSMPQVFAEQQRQAPLQAEQQVGLAQQYAEPLAQAYKTAQETLYPQTSQLQETLAGQAAQGATATEMPDWMRQQYKSDISGQLGQNAGAPIGADYLSRGMQNQLFQQQKYYRDLGLSLAGRQPLSQPAAPATTDYASTFTPGNVMNFMQQGYGTYAQSARPLGFNKGGGASLGFLGQWGGY